MIVATGDSSRCSQPKQRHDNSRLSSSTVDDPVVGLVSSLNRPGGNITGFSFLDDSAVKSLELAKGVAARHPPIAVLFNPKIPITDVLLRSFAKAVRGGSVEVRALPSPAPKASDIASRRLSAAAVA